MRRTCPWDGSCGIPRPGISGLISDKLSAELPHLATRRETPSRWIESTQ